ncbi:MAG: NUDIX domain-containing protein [Pseudomonadota bacterium]
MSLPFFFCALLADPDLRDVVLGHPRANAAARPAKLPDHRLVTTQPGGPVQIQPAPGAEVAGQLATGLGRNALGRLRDYAQLAQLRIAEVTVVTSQGRTIAWSALPPELPQPSDLSRPPEGQSNAAPAAPTEWRSDPLQRAIALAAASELMDHRDLPVEARPQLRHAVGIRALARAAAACTTPTVALRTGLRRSAIRQAPPERSHSGFFAVDTLELQHPRFDGTLSQSIRREVFVSGDAVTVLPWDPERDLVLLVEQWRAGPHARGDAVPWTLEPVAGRRDAHETPEATARREAQEEAGLTLGRLAHVASYYPSPGIAAEHVESFVAEADLSQAGGIHGREDEAENIRAIVIPLERALHGIRTGEIATAPSVLSLLWLRAERARLRAEWARASSHGLDTTGG